MNSRISLGVDIGGTFAKFGITNLLGNVIYRESIPTNGKPCDELISEIGKKCSEIAGWYDISCVGFGVPGSVTGDIVYTDNLPLKNINFKERIQKYISLPVYVKNDADCAALGEVKCGSIGARNLIMITIGTGIGGGIITNGKIYSGRGAAGEIGHLSTDRNGPLCSCGQRGCWEHYASARALAKRAAAACAADENGILNDMYKASGGVMNGKIFFDALESGCELAHSVFEEYMNDVEVGVRSLINIFDPDAVIFSGGIMNRGDVFIKNLRGRIKTDVKLGISTLGSDAGIIGAALLED